MKLWIETLTLFLTFIVILLAGCSGCSVKNAQKNGVETPIAVKDTLTKELLLGDAGEIPIPTSQQQKILPLQTPADYRGDPYFYIQDIEYEKIIKGGEGYGSYPILPPHIEQKLKEIRIWSENNGWMTPEGPITDDEFQRMRLGIISEGFTDLEMAKYFILIGLSTANTKYAQEYAQKALDANPDDYQTLYVWTQTQTEDSKRIQGTRKLLEQNPNDAKMLFQLGSLLIDWEQKTKGAFEESIGYLKRSAALDPDYFRGQAYRFLGGIHVHLGDVEEGLAFYKLAQEVYDWEPTREAIERIEKGDRP